jgi:hypothetical protein
MIIRPGTGRWQAKPDGGVGLRQTPRLAFSAVLPDPSTASRFPSPFRGGFLLERDI